MNARTTMALAVAATCLAGAARASTGTPGSAPPMGWGGIADAPDGMARTPRRDPARDAGEPSAGPTPAGGKVTVEAGGVVVTIACDAARPMRECAEAAVAVIGAIRKGR